ncbi:hypothetical protein [Bifidobacterium oedipodis]|uniref:Uncharacterized protein n=1 Tax=Bifidobacterium oedipodis TaxID=2675322 RepID=A0A7Y0HSC7_9BIFI|nr:hypothetical protein [Bifidobacterium sp. DSM 109957]NMM93871.1 hypothetical protein [Bifidobacterium sp. DSM 109957]
MAEVVHASLETVFPEITEGLDANHLIGELLRREYPYRPEESGTVLVLSGYDPGTDASLQSHDLVIFEVGEPVQVDGNMRAWVWRFPLTLNVLGMNPERAAKIMRHLTRVVASWAFNGTVPDVGAISRVVENPVGHRRSSDLSTSKRVSAWVSDKVLEAHSPH